LSDELKRLPPLLQLLFDFQQVLHACPTGPEQLALALAQMVQGYIVFDE
jgi:ABC-type amino acid transport system permease subunit